MPVMVKTKRERSNLSVSATPEVIAEIDRLVELSPVDTSRSGIALAAIRAGLPAVAKQIGAATDQTPSRRGVAKRRKARSG